MKEFFKELFWFLVSLVIYLIPFVPRLLTHMPEASKEPSIFSTWQAATILIPVILGYACWFGVADHITKRIRNHYEK